MWHIITSYHHHMTHRYTSDYNNILNALSMEEKKLFKERVRTLDKRISQGLVKLTWISAGVQEVFVKECRKHAGEVYKVIAWPSCDDVMMTMVVVTDGDGGKW